MLRVRTERRGVLLLLLELRPDADNSEGLDDSWYSEEDMAVRSEREGVGRVDC